MTPDAPAPPAPPTPPAPPAAGPSAPASAAPHPFVLAPGPHVHASETTSRIMWTVNATLAPAALWGVLVFGLPALAVIAGSIAGALGGEWLAGRMLGSRAALRDGSAFCTGLLLALTLPPELPAWAALLGAFPP